MIRSKFVLTVQQVALFLLATTLPLLAADEAKMPKPSAYAAAKDVASQIETFVKQMEGDLASESEYGDEQKDRVVKDANTVIVLAQVLANHDEEHPMKKSSAGVLKAAQKVAESSGTFADAKAALTELQGALKASTEGEVSWEPAAELAQLMKQVPIVNNRLRSGVGGRRFDRTIDQNIGYATTLAAIAQASQFDTAYCSGTEDEAKWAKICIDMRDAAAAVRDALREKNQSVAKTNLDKLAKTCDDCHHEFRD